MSVELPPERNEPGMCGKLIYNLYGARNAAQDWEALYGDQMERWGFRRATSCSCAFVHRERGLMVVVHGDDFHTVGEDSQLDWFREM